MKRNIDISLKISIHVILVIFAGIIAYWDSFEVPFHFDDSHAIVENPRIRRLSDIPSLFTDIEGSIASRPLTLATFALNYHFGGLDTFGYHVVNVALHLANGILLYFLISAVSSRLKSDVDLRGVALIAALLFTLHPVQTESVTYIVSRSELLSCFFYISGMLIFLRAASSRFSLSYVSLLFTVSMLGMSSRESFATFPFMLLFFDAAFVSIGFREAVRNWKAHLPIFISLVYLGYLLSGYDSGKSAGFDVESLTFGQYVISEVKVHWTYIRLLLLPIGQNVDYDYPIYTSLNGSPWVLAALAGYIFIWAVGMAHYSKNRAVSFLVLWLVVVLLPSLLVPVVDVMFEHRVYLASIGPFVLISLALWRCRPRLGSA